MKMSLPLILIALTITVMLGYRSLGGEKLATENGLVAANTLPLDKETSQVAYETATFGIG